MAAFDRGGAPIPTLHASVKSFFDDSHKPASFKDMVEWNSVRDFLYNFGYPYRTQQLQKPKYPKCAVYNDRRIYAFEMAKAMNLAQEDYSDRMSSVCLQGRNLCFCYCNIFAPRENEFPISMICERIDFLKDIIGDAVTPLHDLRLIGNRALHNEDGKQISPVDKPVVVDRMFLLAKQADAFFRSTCPGDIERTEKFVNKKLAERVRREEEAEREAEVRIRQEERGDEPATTGVVAMILGLFWRRRSNASTVRREEEEAERERVRREEEEAERERVRRCLAPGHIVALYSEHSKRFIRVRGEDVVVTDHDENWQNPDWHDPATHPDSRLTIVDAGNGEIAFHCPSANRFMRLVDGQVDARGGTKDMNCLPDNWGAERFTVTDASHGEW